MWLESAVSLFRSEKLPGVIINDAGFWKEEIFVSLTIINIFISKLVANVKLLLRSFVCDIWIAWQIIRDLY